MIHKTFVIWSLPVFLVSSHGTPFSKHATADTTKSYSSGQTGFPPSSVPACMCAYVHSSPLKHLWPFKAYKIWNVTSHTKPSLTTDELLIPLLFHEYFKHACAFHTVQLLRYLAHWNSIVSDFFFKFLIATYCLSLSCVDLQWFVTAP